MLGILFTSCVNEVHGPLPLRPPEFPATTAHADPNNVLRATVSVRVLEADSVAVRFHLADFPGDDNITPAVRVNGDSAVIPVLGLLPSRRYKLRAVADGPGGTASGDEVEITTGDLPPDLPRYSASGTSATPGFIVFAAGRDGIVIDNTGRVVWFHRFASSAGLNFVAQPNGRYTARPQTLDPYDIEPWIEIDPAGNVTRSLGCALGLQPRPHDLIAQTDGSYWLMCDDTRTFDLTGYGGHALAQVTGTSVQHVGADGRLLFQWSPFDHFSIGDLPPSELAAPLINWTHGNSIDLDEDGNLIVSFRNLGEVTKINTTTGAVMWRLGGSRNQFSFTGSTLPAFSRQHGARMIARGHLILLDNLGDPGESRSERYSLDESARVARLDHSYGSVPGVVTLIGGSVQGLPGGRTLASFGTEGRVEEYDSFGNVTWRIEGNPGYVFRATRIQSLYTPGVGSAR